MLSLFSLSMATVADCIMRNLESATERLQILLKDLPSLDCYKLGLVYAILEKLYKESSQPRGKFNISLTKQRKMIQLLKFCFKTSKVMAMDLFSIRHKLLPDYSNDHTFYKMMLRYDDEIKSELFKVMDEDKEMELSVLNYRPHQSSLFSRIAAPSSLTQVVASQSKYLVDLKLFCRITMPNCRFIHLRELALSGARFQHEPIQLTDMPLLSVLALRDVTGISVSLYKKLACKLTLPNLNAINFDNGGGLQFAFDNYRCDCSDSCLLNLFWLGAVSLYQPDHVTRGFLTCVGVKREY